MTNLIVVSLAKLSDSRYGNDEDVKTMLESFEKPAKPTFTEDVNDKSFIKFGSVRDKDPNVGIKSGQLTIDGCGIGHFICLQLEHRAMGLMTLYSH